MGGATLLVTVFDVISGGLSPRGRGNPVGRVKLLLPIWSIPAWAGQPPLGGILQLLDSVYPRVGGGNHATSRMVPLISRSIPAWAGQPNGSAGPRYAPRVYPRVGGATADKAVPRDNPKGLSPRGRGNLGRFQRGANHPGSIPAWAGQPSEERRGHRRTAVYPRVGGATHRDLGRIAAVVGLSPRGRGNPDGFLAVVNLNGSIPAWAGQPPHPPTPANESPVYPRVGGATQAASVTLIIRAGLSPRGRGNLYPR